MAGKNEVVPKVKPTTRRWMGALSMLFCVVWFLMIVSDYLFHHPYYTQTIAQFKYWGLLGLLLAVFCGTYIVLSRLPFKKSKRKGIRVNGLKIYLLFLLLLNIVVTWYGISNKLFEANPLMHLLYFNGFNFLLHLAVFYVVAVGYAIGESLLRPVTAYLSSFSQKLVAIPVGWSLVVLLIMVLGILQALTPWVVWPLFILISIWKIRAIGRFSRAVFWNTMPAWKPRIQGITAMAMLLVFTAVNSIGTIKAFPMGFDGAGLYMNITQLISEYNALPAGGQAFNWSVLMSLGELLFGSTTIAILLSSLMGVFCCLAVYGLAKLFVSTNNSLLAAAIFYTAPLITFHNRYDEKVDLGFLFVSLSTLLLLLEFYKNKGGTVAKEKIQMKWGKLSLGLEPLIWIFAGWLTGFAFGIKYTALFNGIALVGFLFYRRGGGYAFLGSLFTALSLIFLLGIYRFANFELDQSSPWLLFGLLFLPGIALMGWAYRKQLSNLRKTTSLASLFLLTVGLAFSPWGIKNLGENKKLSVSALVEGKSPTPAIRVKPKYRTQLNPSNQQAKAAKEKVLGRAASKTQREEVQRYQGFEKGLPLFLSLPYDLTMNTNLPNQSYLDMGFLWLLLLPVLLFSLKPRSALKNLAAILLMVLIGFISIQSVYVKKTPPQAISTLIDGHPPGLQKTWGKAYESGMNLWISGAKAMDGFYNWIANFGFTASLTAILLLLLVMVWLTSERRKAFSKSLKGLLAYLMAYLLLWFLLGSGIPWYAFPALALLPLVVVYYVEHPQAYLGAPWAKFSKYFLGVGVGLYFLLNVSLHFSDYNNQGAPHLFLKTPFFQYATHNIDRAEALWRFSPFYQEAARYLNRNLDEKIYRVGTFMQYHIKQNDRRVLEDNQLGKFENTRSKLDDPSYFLSVLRDNGFRFVLYDLQSASLDKTPEQSLYKKNIDFLNLLLNPNEVKVVVTDRIVEDPAGGVIQLPGGSIAGRSGLSGNIVFQGSFVLFELL
ncbi:MAG: hypothetical protein KTR30_37155 [Saprospiraceae bacterium]|nr:hypothetical protein [Saprospiraceae bacterium]